MRLFFLVPFVLITNSLFSQTPTSNDCTNIKDVKVEIANIEPEQDSIAKKKSWGTYIKNCLRFRLTTKDSNYTIERFVISGEYDNGDVGEIFNEGNCFTSATIKLIADCKKDKEFNIFCIKAKDKFGKECILKPFSHRFR